MELSPSCFTDIEGSTRLLKELRERYGKLRAEHERIMRAAFAEAGGQEVDTQGDLVVDGLTSDFPPPRSAAGEAAELARGRERVSTRR